MPINCKFKYIIDTKSCLELLSDFKSEFTRSCKFEGFLLKVRAVDDPYCDVSIVFGKCLLEN